MQSPVLLGSIACEPVGDMSGPASTCLNRRAPFPDELRLRTTRPSPIERWFETDRDRIRVSQSLPKSDRCLSTGLPREAKLAYSQYESKRHSGPSGKEAPPSIEPDCCALRQPWGALCSRDVRKVGYRSQKHSGVHPCPRARVAAATQTLSPARLCWWVVDCQRPVLDIACSGESGRGPVTFPTRVDAPQSLSPGVFP